MTRRRSGPFNVAACLGCFAVCAIAVRVADSVGGGASWQSQTAGFIFQGIAALAGLFALLTGLEAWDYLVGRLRRPRR